MFFNLTCRYAVPKRKRNFRQQGEKIINNVVHFEMPYDNRERVAKFYESVFGWQKQMIGENMGNYALATTTGADENGPQNPGAIKLYKKSMPRKFQLNI
jgi:predicted enzyme related to lactoylglutathione lyase